MTTEWKTWTGVPVDQIPARLAEPFSDPRAYKGVPGGADLTDIDTGFTLERVSAVFGPKGLGWNFLFDKADLGVLGGEPTPGKRVMVHLSYAVFQYVLVDGAGNRLACEIPTSGANENLFQYAEEGARTSALGAALKGLGFQLPVYKGLLDHHNAARLIGAGGGSASAAAGSPAAAAGNGHKPAAPAAKPVAPANGRKPAAAPVRSTSAPATALAEPGAEIEDLDDAPAAPGRPAEQGEPEPDAERDHADFSIPIGRNLGKKLAEVDVKWLKWAAFDMALVGDAHLQVQRESLGRLKWITRQPTRPDQAEAVQAMLEFTRSPADLPDWLAKASPARLTPEQQAEKARLEAKAALKAEITAFLAQHGLAG